MFCHREEYHNAPLVQRKKHRIRLNRYLSYSRYRLNKKYIIDAIEYSNNKFARCELAFLYALLDLGYMINFLGTRAIAIYEERNEQGSSTREKTHSMISSSVTKETGFFRKGTVTSEIT